jgi:hypothetical protein
LDLSGEWRLVFVEHPRLMGNLGELHPFRKVGRCKLLCGVGYDSGLFRFVVDFKKLRT